MKVTVHVDGRERAAKPQGDHVRIECPCPHCKASPLLARGTGIRSHDHDTYYADAVALCCGKPIGRMSTTVSTIFGIEEDERVLNGRARVYG